MGEVFDGKFVQDGRKNFIEQAQNARQRRAEVMQRQEAALVITRFFKRAVLRKKSRTRTRNEFLELMKTFDGGKEGQLIPCVDVFEKAYRLMRKTWFIDPQCLEQVCRYINWSALQKNPVYSYLGVGLIREKAKRWVEHLKDIVVNCLNRLKELRPSLANEVNKMALVLTTLVNLTSLDKWPLLEEAKFAMLKLPMRKFTYAVVCSLKNGKLLAIVNDLLEQALARPGQFPLKKPSLYAISKLISLTYQNIEDGTAEWDPMKEMILQIMVIPGFINYVHAMCPCAMDTTNFPDMIRCAADENLSDQVNANDALCILANFVQLGEYCGQLNDVFYPYFAKLVNRLLWNNALKKCEGATSRHWHPILGWIDCPVRSSVLKNVPILKEQLAFLWGPAYQEAVFHPLYTFLANYAATNPPLVEISSRGSMSQSSSSSSIPTSKSSTTLKSSIVKAFRKALFLDGTQGSGATIIRLTADITVLVSEACKLYYNICSSFSLCKLDFLTGICFKQNSKLLIALWQFLKMTGVGIKDSAVKTWADLMLNSTDPVQEHLLVLSTDAMTHYITILDDQEFYEDQPVFRIDELRQVSGFLNQLCYRLITHSNYNMLRDSTWISLKTLLIALYRRDCRKRYCPEDHWLVDNTKMNQLIVDIEKGRKHAKRVLYDMPHVLREDHRVILFRKWATSEKTLNGIGSASSSLEDIPTSSTLITIHRSRIVEDGYSQLATLSPSALKGTIRVRFQNELGLDEAGIDQDGVFKEFLEETINTVFNNPSLNLFRATNENLLYPSPMSYVHENHLQLYEFVGKMLAKAIFEGIVVDVHFAPFFLSLMLGHQQSALFSAIDELQFFDKDLYKSLSYVKHHEGDVSELELTFSVDQDVFGEIRTTELIPGGKTIRVTNQNKISYLYQMANFHLHTQIKDQTAAFVTGFRSIIPTDWLRIFSPLELQRLISGEDSDIDLVDLRRNTQYYGGFHDNHRVIMWLWEILDHDFSEVERRLFLKFVTSCSKPPLLGFVNLDPPFSIRCVEVSDDEDTGDTLGSVLRGFLTIGKRDPVGRLPTSSTCFNLLKLPNYQKKSTLRDKLRYAITANVGFELS